LTAKTSLPTPQDYKVIAEEHHTLKDGEELKRFMARIWPLPVVPDDWVELDDIELSEIEAQDGTIIAAVRQKATQTQCVKAARLTDDCSYKGWYAGTWVHFEKWNAKPVDHEVPYTEQEQEDGREFLIKYILIHEPKRLELQDLPKQSLQQNCYITEGK
jgi:hypothetical protein